MNVEPPSDWVEADDQKVRRILDQFDWTREAFSNGEYYYFRGNKERVAFRTIDGKWFLPMPGSS